MSPSNFAASNNLALALCEQSDNLKKNRALEYAQINAQRYPKMADAASTLGWVQYRLGHLQGGRDGLERRGFFGQPQPRHGLLHGPSLLPDLMDS